VLFADKRLNVCSGRMSCCTSVMETYLVNMTRWQFHGRVLNKMRELHLLFANVTSTFDGMFLKYLMNIYINKAIEVSRLCCICSSKMWKHRHTDIDAY